MQLKEIAVQSGSGESKQLDLYWMVNFKEHWEPLLCGRVKLGLKGAELRLKLEGG